MTDNVNVPTPYMVEQCRKLLQPLAGNDWPQVARQAFALMTAAAPKAEPVSDPYKLEFEPCNGCGATEPSEMCFGCSHDFKVLNKGPQS